MFSAEARLPPVNDIVRCHWLASPNANVWVTQPDRLIVSWERDFIFGWVKTTKLTMELLK